MMRRRRTISGAAAAAANREQAHRRRLWDERHGEIVTRMVVSARFIGADDERPAPGRERAVHRAVERPEDGRAVRAGERSPGWAAPRGIERAGDLEILRCAGDVEDHLE